MMANLSPRSRPSSGKADREGADLVEHLRPGPGLPDAEILVPHRRAAAASPRCAAGAWETYQPPGRRSPRPPSRRFAGPAGVYRRNTRIPPRASALVADEVCGLGGPRLKPEPRGRLPFRPSLGRFADGRAPARNWSRSSASSALAVLRCRVFDVAESADLFGDAGEPDRKVVVGGRKPGADSRAASRSPRSASAPSAARGNSQTDQAVCPAGPGTIEHPERRHHPRAEAHLARQARSRVAARQERRREMEFEAQIVAVELVGDLLRKRRRYRAARLRIRPCRPSA